MNLVNGQTIVERQGKNVERTLCIIKPDAVEKKYAGNIIARIEEEGFTILGL